MLAQLETGVKINGFELGAHTDSLDFHALQKMGKFQKLLRYDLAGDNIAMDGIPLKYFKLFIWDNHLHSIDIKAMGADGDALHLWIQSVFGEGKKLDNMGYRYEWVLPEIRILWDQNLVTKDGMASFIANKVHRSYYKYMYNRENGTN